MLFMKMVRNFCILGEIVLKKREIRYHSYFGYSQFPLGYRLFESNEFIRTEPFRLWSIFTNEKPRIYNAPAFTHGILAQYL